MPTTGNKKIARRASTQVAASASENDSKGKDPSTVEGSFKGDGPRVPLVGETAQMVRHTHQTRRDWTWKSTAMLVEEVADGREENDKRKKYLDKRNDSCWERWMVLIVVQGCGRSEAASENFQRAEELSAMAALFPGGRRAHGKMEKRAAEGLEEADHRSADLETGDRQCRSRHVRDP